MSKSAPERKKNSEFPPSGRLSTQAEATGQAHVRGYCAAVSGALTNVLVYDLFALVETRLSVCSFRQLANEVFLLMKQ